MDERGTRKNRGRFSRTSIQLRGGAALRRAVVSLSRSSQRLAGVRASCDTHCVSLDALESFQEKLASGILAPHVDLVDDFEGQGSKVSCEGTNMGTTGLSVRRPSVSRLSLPRFRAAGVPVPMSRAEPLLRSSAATEASASSRILPRKQWTLKHVLLHVVLPACGHHLSWVQAGRVREEDLVGPERGTLVVCSQDVPLADLLKVLRQRGDGHYYWIAAFSAPYKVASSGPGRDCMSKAEEFADCVALIDDWVEPSLLRDLGSVYALSKLIEQKLPIEVLALESAQNSMASYLAESFVSAKADGESQVSWENAIYSSVLGRYWALRIENMCYTVHPIERIQSYEEREVAGITLALEHNWRSEVKPMLISKLLEWLVAILETIAKKYTNLPSLEHAKIGVGLRQEVKLTTILDIPPSALLLREHDNTHLYKLPVEQASCNDHSSFDVTNCLTAVSLVAKVLAQYDLAKDCLINAMSQSVTKSLECQYLLLHLAWIDYSRYNDDDAAQKCDEILEIIECMLARFPEEDFRNEKEVKDLIRLKIDVVELIAEISMRKLDLNSAMENIEYALTEAHRIFKPCSGRIAGLLLLQGIALSHQGKRVEALSQMQMVVRLCELALGVNHLETAKAQLWLAVTLSSMDNWQQSQEVIEVAVGSLRSCLGARSLIVYDAQHVLANALYDVGERGQALKLSEATHHEVEILLGEDTPHISRVYHLRTLGILQAKLHLWENAATTFTTALNILDDIAPRMERFGSTRVLLLTRLALARCELDDPSFEHATNLLHQARQVNLRIKDPLVLCRKRAQQRCMFSAVLVRQKETTEALEELDLAMAELDLDEDCALQRATIYSAQGFVYTRMRCTGLAVDAFKESLMLLQNTFGSTPHHLVVHVLFALSRCLSEHSRVRNLEEAWKYGLQALEMSQTLARGQPSLIVYRAHTNMAGLFARRKNAGRALEQLRAGVAVLEDLPDWTDRDLGLALTRVGILERSVLRKPRMALKTFEKALTRLESLPNVELVDLSELLLARGICYQLERRLDEALDDFRQAAKIREEVRGKRDSKLAEALWRISEVLEAKGEFEEALELSKKASRIASRDISRVRKLANRAGLLAAVADAAAEGEELKLFPTDIEENRVSLITLPHTSYDT